jgi:DNA-binding NtrC family response regulator
VSEPVIISDTRSGRGKRARAGLGLRVLAVEDDEQVLTVLMALLETEGYEVTVASSAGEGLEKLRQGVFHLVISDYWLPDKTGAWMLSEASSRGFLGDSMVLVITAEHRPQGVENLRVLKKPLDLDDFLRVVHDVLGPVRKAELDRAKEEVQRVHQSEDTITSAFKIELTLYISSSSPTSLKALRNLRGLVSFE